MVTHNKAGQEDCKEQHTKGIKKVVIKSFFKHFGVRCKNSARDFVGLIDDRGVIAVLIKDKYKVIRVGRGTLIAHSQL